MVGFGHVHRDYDLDFDPWPNRTRDAGLGCTDGMLGSQDGFMAWLKNPRSTQQFGSLPEFHLGLSPFFRGFDPQKKFRQKKQLVTFS